jgi:hypothetical protein
MLAKKSNDTAKLEALLPVAQDRQYLTDELDILLQLLPTHIANPSFPTTQLMEEEKRARTLAFEMLDVLSAAELNRPFLPAKMQLVEALFQILSHPNPEMKVVYRLDWLDKEDYKPSVVKIGQLEIRRDVFLARAIAFLGRSVVSSMIGIVDRMSTQPPATTQDGKVKAIFEAVEFGKEILTVSAIM